MGETRHCGKYKGSFILILYYLETLQITAQLWCDWDIFYQVTRHHSPGSILPAEALGRITFTLFVWEDGLIAASFHKTSTPGWFTTDVITDFPFFLTQYM